jgi:hypothetical protein
MCNRCSEIFLPTCISKDMMGDSTFNNALSKVKLVWIKTWIRVANEQRRNALILMISSVTEQTLWTLTLQYAPQRTGALCLKVMKGNWKTLYHSITAHDVKMCYRNDGFIIMFTRQDIHPQIGSDKYSPYTQCHLLTIRFNILPHPCLGLPNANITVGFLTLSCHEIIIFSRLLPVLLLD